MSNSWDRAPSSSEGPVARRGSFQMWRWDTMPPVAKDTWTHYYAIKYLRKHNLRTPPALEDQVGEVMTVWQEYLDKVDTEGGELEPRESDYRVPRVTSLPESSALDYSSLLRCLANWASLSADCSRGLVRYMAAQYLIETRGRAPVDLVDMTKGLPERCIDDSHPGCV
jgi:hypothetical protein